MATFKKAGPVIDKPYTLLGCYSLYTYTAESSKKKKKKTVVKLGKNETHSYEDPKNTISQTHRYKL